MVINERSFREFFTFYVAARRLGRVVQVQKYLCYETRPNRGLPTTFPDRNRCGYDNIICDAFCAWSVINEIINVCLDQISVVFMAVKRHMSEEVYTGRLAGCLYDGLCCCFCV